jgi:hypothetical protein
MDGVIHAVFVEECKNVRVDHRSSACGKIRAIDFHPGSRCDIVSHRFSMGTALLGDGFYSFDSPSAI